MKKKIESLLSFSMIKQWFIQIGKKREKKKTMVHTKDEIQGNFFIFQV